MRLGSILFVLPFLFVTNPALILQGDIAHILLATATALLAIWLIASALEGYLYRIGTLGPVIRLACLASGAALIYPERLSDVLGLAIVVGLYGLDQLSGGRLGQKSSPAVSGTA